MSDLIHFDTGIENEEPTTLGSPCSTCVRHDDLQVHSKGYSYLDISTIPHHAKHVHDINRSSSEVREHPISQKNRGNDVYPAIKTPITAITPQLPSFVGLNSSIVISGQMDERIKEFPTGFGPNLSRRHPMESTFLNQQDYISPLNFSTEIIRFLQISQGNYMHPHEKYKRVQPPVDGEKIVATEPTLWPVRSKHKALARPNVMNVSSMRTLAFRSTKRIAREIIKNHVRSIKHYVKERANLSVGEIHESILQELAHKHPKYSQVIRMLPLLLKYVPEKVKKDLMTKEHAEIVKIGIMIMKKWSLWTS